VGRAQTVLGAWAFEHDRPPDVSRLLFHIVNYAHYGFQRSRTRATRREPSGPARSGRETAPARHARPVCSPQGMFPFHLTRRLSTAPSPAIG
jgi:hypothetical protein